MCKFKVEDWVGATELIIKLKPTDYECTFSRGKAEPRPFTRGCTCKNSNGDGLSNFVGFEIWVNRVFSGGVENWHYFFCYIKLRPQQHFFTHDYNVLFRNYCVAIASKICNPATPVHGARAKFADK